MLLKYKGVRFAEGRVALVALRAIPASENPLVSHAIIASQIERLEVRQLELKSIKRFRFEHIGL